MRKRIFVRSSISMLILSVFACAGLFGLYTMRASAEPEAMRYDSAALHWKKCADAIDGYPHSELSCATIRVPLDYNKPNGKKISVAISRVAAANPQTKRGVLFLNPGGPGGPGIDLPQLFTILMPAKVLAQYDLIGFDPRGVGQSSPVSCGLSAEDASMAMVPQAQPGGFAATSAFMEKIAKSCARTSGTTMPFMTTNNTARDMDQIRLALGQRKISYLGYSYGTYLGSVYASLFPNRTDRFVLDSSVGTQWVWREQFRNWRLADRDRFPDFAQYLIDNDSEFHFGTTQTAISDVFESLVKKLNAKPLVFDDGSTFNGEQFRQLSFGALYSDSSFPEAGAIWQYLSEATAGTVKTAAMKTAIDGLLGRSSAKTQDTAILDNNAASALAVVCDDTAWSKTPAQYQTELKTDTLIAPKFGPVGSQIWPCAFWRTAPKEPLTTISSQGPRDIMIVQNLRDPATPYIGAQDMRDKLGERAQLVTVDQGGHAAAYLAANQCASDTVTNFLTTGKLAATDSICDAETAATSSAQRSMSSQKSAKTQAIEQFYSVCVSTC